MLETQNIATFSDDGSPVTKGTILFVQENFQALGEIQPNGNDVIGSYRTNDGLPPGTDHGF
jgi:hypothetical protein